MRVRRAHEVSDSLARLMSIVDEAAVAADQRIVLDAQEWMRLLLLDACAHCQVVRVGQSREVQAGWNGKVLHMLTFRSLVVPA
jgi:hypothetical protein